MVRIGIDLGTTNTSAALVYQDGVRVIDTRDNDRCACRSVVTYLSRSKVQVGRIDDYLDEPTIAAVKRLMGRSHAEAIREQAFKYFHNPRVVPKCDSGGDLTLEVRPKEGRPFDVLPYQVAAHILKNIVVAAGAALDEDAIEAVVTVPAYFKDSHREATLKAAREAGLPILGHLLDEPSAAAFAYGHLIGLPDGEPLLVFDWGGGTFDITVQITDGKRWRQLATGGDLCWGGDDVDLLLLQRIIEKARLPQELGDDDDDEARVARDRLKSTAMQTKHLLTGSERAPVTCAFSWSGRTWKVAVEITRAEFEALLAPEIEAQLAKVDETLSAAAVFRDRIAEVLLVGGSSRIPLFRRLIASRFPQAKIHCDDVDPMDAVAFGAAIRAQELETDLGFISPYGLGIVRERGELLRLIEPNQQVPTPKVRLKPEPRTRYRGQTRYQLDLVSFSAHEQLTGLEPVVPTFASGFEGRPVDSLVETEVWLDEEKRARIRCRPKGAPEWVEMDTEAVALRSSEGGGMWRALQEQLFKAEATLELNAGDNYPLLQSLREAQRLACALTQSDDQAEIRANLERLRDVLERIEARASDEGQTSSERERVVGWVRFYEYDLLPQFRGILSPESWRSAVEILRRVRVLEETGGGDAEFRAQLMELRRTLHAGELGPLVAAMVEGHVRGVQAETRKLATDLLQQGIRQHQAGDVAAFARTIEEANAVARRADEEWREWSGSHGIELGDPRLKLDDEDDE